MKCKVKITLKCLENGMNISLFVPTTTSTTTTQEPCFIVDCEGDFIIDCDCNGLSCGDCEVECYIVDCDGNIITDCLGDLLSCGECGTVSTTTTLFPASTTSTTTILPITTSSTTTSGGFDQDLINYMVAIDIPYDNTVYFDGTPQEITGIGLWNVMADLIADLKESGVWQKSVAIYPYVGGTEYRHSINLKTPYNLNSAKRLVFMGNWTHSPTGSTPTTGVSYAQTYIYLPEDVPQYSFTGGTYFRTIGVAMPNSFYTFGVSGADQDNSSVFMFLNAVGGHDVTAGTMSGRITGNFAALPTGFTVMTCFRDNVFRLYRNGVLVGSNSASRIHYFNNPRPMDSTTTIALASRLIGNIVQPQVAINCERAFDYFGQGMDTAQMLALNAAIANFQTTLNRNV